MTIRIHYPNRRMRKAAEDLLMPVKFDQRTKVARYMYIDDKAYRAVRLEQDAESIELTLVLDSKE